jgi:acyl CoA:acetate/3-ketoacid CoA transferase alpha subunit
MAFDATNLYLGTQAAPGSNTYFYRTTDTMATVIAASYFDFGPNTAPRLVAGDLIFALCSDGNMWLKIYSASDTTGICITQFAGGNLPVQTWATGSAAGDFGMSVGLYEVGGSGTAAGLASGSRGVLPHPYPGAEVLVRRVGTGTLAQSFVAGASGTGTDAGNWVVGLNTYGNATSITFDGTNRMVNLAIEGDYFHVRADSASRWRILSHFITSSAVSQGGSVWLTGT